ncbi:MAG: polyprenyl synthetase family protein [Candidatus Thorarchaeota archaeon]|nr:polyprenyl synthetase family protein [Candidatus Thorarchaeota archaeon]
MPDPRKDIDILETALDDNENSSRQLRRQKIDLRASKELHKRLAIIDEEIIRVFKSERGEPEILYDTAQHLLQAGGKHVRSLLTTLSCEAVGGSFNEALPFAVATEFVQTASLIHDDVIDDDAIRRGVESTHRKFGSRMAIIAGDLLIARAMKLVSDHASLELMNIVAAAGIQMCEGEASDILMYLITSNQFTTKSYFDVVRRKTVSFMRAAAKVGAMIGKASEEQSSILEIFGEQMGYAFQIKDDILDVVASENSVGKSVLSDLKGNKTNYVLVHALESSSEEEAKHSIELLKNGEIDFALDLIKRSDSIEHADSLAYEYAAKAKETIRNKGFLNEDLLCALADHACDRDF